MRDTGLADRLRAKGLTVKEVAGWKTRGNDGGGNPTFRPMGAINHHTAGSAFGDAPSLATVIYGRPDVPGPLAQVLQSREVDANGLDVIYVVAAGKANHGGVGTWTGTGGTFDSNYESEGNEVEHTGTTTVHANRRETMARVAAAFLEAPGSSRDATMACQHFEYAQPPGRKIDFHDLAPWTTSSFRDRVRFWIGRTDDQEFHLVNEEDKTILRNIVRQEMYGDETAHSKGYTPIIRNEVRAVLMEMFPNGYTAAFGEAMRVAVGKSQGVDGEAAAQVRARANEGALGALQKAGLYTPEA